MAESFFDDQNPCNCPVCLDVLKDPVTTACGHSFCMGCIEECWDQEDHKEVYSCPQCRQTFNQRPTLSRNTVLAELVERMKKEAPEPGKVPPLLCPAGPEDVKCDVCTGTKLKATKSCLVCLASYCETHIQPHYESSPLKKHKLLNASPNLQDQICSKHDKPLEVYCQNDQQCICMLCMFDAHSEHKTVSAAAERADKQNRLKMTQNDVQYNIQQREMKVQELKKGLDCLKRSAQAAVENIEEIFNELISSIEERRDKITELIRNRVDNEVRNVEEQIQIMEQEITDLRRRNNELEEFSCTENDIYFLQNFSSISGFLKCRNIYNIVVNDVQTFENVEKLVSELQNKLDDLFEQDIFRISEKVAAVKVIECNEKISDYLLYKPRTREEFLKYSCDLSLDFCTACSHLIINYKTVRRHFLVGTCNKCHCNPKGCTYQVLCQENLTGRRYFEVEWRGTGCSISFSYDKISLKRKTPSEKTFGSNNRSWKFDFPIANLDLYHNSLQSSIPLVSSKIGVFLDQEAGTLSFFRVLYGKMKLLHEFQIPFTEPLYPGFSFRKLGTGSSVTICNLRC